jgi:hypothetical protein
MRGAGFHQTSDSYGSKGASGPCGRALYIPPPFSLNGGIAKNPPFT